MMARADVRGRQVNGDVGGRNIVAAILQRGADAVPALAHGGVGQAHSVEVAFVGADAGNIYLDFDDVGVYAIDGGAECLVKHPGTRMSTGTRLSCAKQITLANRGTRFCDAGRKAV